MILFWLFVGVNIIFGVYLFILSFFFPDKVIVFVKWSMQSKKYPRLWDKLFGWFIRSKYFIAYNRVCSILLIIFYVWLILDAFKRIKGM